MVLTTTAISYIFAQFQALSMSLIPVAAQDLSAHHKSVLEAINGFPSDWRGPSAKLASALLQFDFEKYMPKSEGGYIHGTVVVPLTKEGNHSYEINHPVCIHYDATALKMDGSLGNSLPKMNGTNVRSATKEEIIIFYTAIIKPEIVKQVGTQSFIKRMFNNAKIEISA